MSLVRVASNSYLALVHYPVYDRHRKVVATSITNLDIHDIARSSRTYGLAGYFLVHPVAAQRELADRIVHDWGYWNKETTRETDEESDRSPRSPSGSHDLRRAALSLVRTVASLEDVVAGIIAERGQPPLIVATSARPTSAEPGAVREAPELIQELAQTERPLLLLFGTGWGMTDEVMARTDRLLPPIYGPAGPGTYNHLSVRSAAGIILDRLFGRPDAVSGDKRP